MKGQILDYSIQKNAGVITAEDGARYKFEGAEWHADMQPTRGASVDFDIENGMAVGIYRSLNSTPARVAKSASSNPSSTSGKSKIVAAIFALFLGTFGAHKFYTGAWGWDCLYWHTHSFYPFVFCCNCGGKRWSFDIFRVFGICSWNGCVRRIYPLLSYVRG